MTSRVRRHSLSSTPCPRIPREMFPLLHLEMLFLTWRSLHFAPGLPHSTRTIPFSFIVQEIHLLQSTLSSSVLPSRSKIANCVLSHNRILDFKDATDEQLAALAEACQPASFGIAEKDVLDESYRKAGKMECTDFATQFCPHASKIVDKIRKSLLQGRNDATIEVEMYKLNVYGEYCL